MLTVNEMRIVRPDTIYGNCRGVIVVERICDNCGETFDYPATGGAPGSGDYEGVPLCPDCYLIETQEKGEDEG